MDPRRAGNDFVGVLRWLRNNAHSRRIAGTKVQPKICPGTGNHHVGGAFNAYSMGRSNWFVVVLIAFGAINANINCFAGGSTALIIIRILIGAAQGPYLPMVTQMLSSWIPPAERSFTTTFVYSGVGVSAGMVFL